jgi:hypothetical protein
MVLDSPHGKGHIASMAESTRKKRPRDPNQLGKMIVDISVGEVEDRGLTAEEQGKDPAAVDLGRRGGLKGGKARAKALTPEQRAEIARVAASARWKKK